MTGNMKSEAEIRERLEMVRSDMDRNNDDEYQYTLIGQSVSLQWVLDSYD